jgi:glycosyltransferase involved in cell wall biosynthesis
MIADSRAIQDHLLQAYNKTAIYIPYGAEPFHQPRPAALDKYGLSPFHYSLLVARMESENNIEMIISGHVSARVDWPLFVVGNIGNKYGRYLTHRFQHPSIVFSEAIYDQSELDNLRYHSLIYFHGHSVGGTNPSLLEAMACGCPIAAHDNKFNKAILQQHALYFKTADDVANLLRHPLKSELSASWKMANLKKIHTLYNKERIVDAYERLMLEACGVNNLILQPFTAKAV